MAVLSSRAQGSQIVSVFVINISTILKQEVDYI